MNPAGVSDAPNTYGFVAKKVEALTIHGVAQPVSQGLINNVGESTDTDLQDVTTLST